MSYTPGPWKYEYNGDKREHGYISESSPRDGGNFVAIARVTSAGHKYNEVEANARLIAAAPELVEMLEEAARWMRFYDESPVLDRTAGECEALLARIKGEA